MKTISVLILSAFFVVSCSKSTVTNTPPPPSQWALNGKSYQGDSTFLDSSYSLNYASMTSLAPLDTGYVAIYFDILPTQNKTYNIITGVQLRPTNNQNCWVEFGNGITRYQSLGGEHLNVTIVNRKVQAAFTNIALKNVYAPYDTVYASATLYQNL